MDLTFIREEVIDLCGVLADPCGIYRPELVRLAMLRKPVCFFDTARVSKEGLYAKFDSCYDFALTNFLRSGK
jgi:hypothetical protein